MTFTPPTLDEKHAILIALAKALFPGIDISEMSDEWLWTRIQAAASTANHAHQKATINDIIPDNSEGSLLDRWANIRGVSRKGATGARKDAALRVFGVPAEDVPDGRELAHNENGLRVRIQGDYIIGPGNYVDVNVVAIDVGVKTRFNKGERFTFVAGPPSPDIEDEAELQLDMDEGGEDAESDGDLRLRVLSRFRDPPLGGNATDYIQWALEVAGFSMACSYSLRRGLGTVHLSALHDGSGAVRAPSAPECANLQAIIDAKRPAAMKGFLVLNVTAETTNVEVKITPNTKPENAFDWNDQVAPTVSAFAANVLKFNGGARPATMKAGHRIINAVGATGKERVIQVLGPAADEVTLEPDATGDTFANGNTVYSGGPLVAPARAAIQELFDSFGTANPDAVPGPFGDWEANLRPGDVRDAAKVEGARDAECVTPGAIVAPTNPSYPNDASVGLLIAGRIIARKKW